MRSEYERLLEACLKDLQCRHGGTEEELEADLRRLAGIVALAVAEEREACAVLAEEQMRLSGSSAAERVAGRIRTREFTTPIVEEVERHVDPELPAGRYRHFKGGLYQVLGVARHSETEEWLVLYRPLYGAGGLWLRPREMFLERVRASEGEVPRFRYLGPILSDEDA